MAVRRTLAGAAQWRDYEWTILYERASPILNAALDEAPTATVGDGRSGPPLRIGETDEPAVIIDSFQPVTNEDQEPRLPPEAAGS